MVLSVSVYNSVKTFMKCRVIPRYGNGSSRFNWKVEAFEGPKKPKTHCFSGLRSRLQLFPSRCYVVGLEVNAKIFRLLYLEMNVKDCNKPLQIPAICVTC
jgi:hypothetical protein